eukprot:s883_g2.t1
MAGACKYYEPTDVTGEWHHAAESCGDDKDEGHFKWNTDTRIWEMEESSKLEHESVEGEVLTQDDNDLGTVLPLLRAASLDGVRSRPIQDACKQFFLANYQACTNLQDCEALDPRLLCELMRLNTSKMNLSASGTHDGASERAGYTNL